MRTLLRFLFPTTKSESKYSLLLLGLRLIVGGLMLAHGCDKLVSFDLMKYTSPDPIGLGSECSLILTIFAEVLCACAILFGLLTRLAAIPLIFTMIIAIFVIHAGQIFAMRELAVLYLLGYSLLLIAGPGKYSIDQWLGERLTRKA